MILFIPILLGANSLVDGWYCSTRIVIVLVVEHYGGGETCRKSLRWGEPHCVPYSTIEYYGEELIVCSHRSIVN